jgi:hypothetical protein
LKSKGKSTTKAWDDISRRLRDSFGSAVYVNGNLRKDSVRFYEKNPTQRDGWSEAEGGREVLMRYLKSIHPKSKKSEIVLVCVAAMYYAKFLEKGQHRGGYKIKVISGARTYIDKHWKEAVSGIYKKTGLKKPVSFVKKGDNSEL